MKSITRKTTGPATDANQAAEELVIGRTNGDAPVPSATNWFSGKELNIFIITNVLLFGILTFWILRKVDASSVTVESVLGSNPVANFIQPIAFRNADSSFVQLAHAPTNSKVMILIVPRSDSTQPASTGGADKKSSLLQQLRSAHAKAKQPDANSLWPAPLKSFLLGHFDPRRAVRVGSYTVTPAGGKAGGREGEQPAGSITFEILKVKNSDRYAVATVKSSLGEVGIVAFKSGAVLPRAILDDLIKSFPSLLP